MAIVKRVLIFIFSIYGFTVFLALMLVLFPFFIVAFFLPRPADGNMVYRIAGVWAVLFLFLTGIRYRTIYRQKPAKGHSYIFVTNHISYLDIPMMIMATKGFLVRILGKAEMGNIPLFGFIYKAGAVTVKRDNSQNRKESIAKLKAFLSEKISILICPEGTFNMTNQPLKEFYDGAFKIAIELKRPIVPVIFPDTYDRLGYHSIFSLNPGICRSVILPAIPTDEYGEEDVLKLKERVYNLMEAEIDQLNVSWVKS